MRQLDLALLHSFRTIVECGSLAQAALRLHKTQAAISLQLKKLEDQVGKRLLDRGNQQAQPTAEGELLLQYARRLLALSDEAMALFVEEALTGTVRFGIPDDYAGAFLPPVLRQFTERHPRVRLKIRNDISQHLFSALEQGELDLALVTLRAGDGAGEILRCDPLHWIAASDYQAQPGLPVPLALYPHGCGYRRQILSALGDSQRDYEISFECTGVTGVQLAVDSGLAIAATSAPLIQPGWRILDTESAALPALGSVTIELRFGPHEISPATRGFADELRRVVMDKH